MRKIVIAAAIVAGLGLTYGVWDTQRKQQASLAEAEAQLERKLAQAAPRAPVFERAHTAPALHARMGQLEIPGVHISVPVVEGADERGLKMGAGHIVGTAYPGDAANVGIAAHRDTYFRALSRIRRGDEIRLTTPAGVFRYEVGAMEIVTPQDVRVLQSAGKAEMTLVTCYPFYYVGHAPKRFIVHARLVSSSVGGRRG